MPVLTPTQRSALGYWWNLIDAAARQGLTTTETISMANEVASTLGQKLSFQENTAISQLYGYARRIVNSGTAFQSASPDRSISSEMVATPPYARDQQEQNAYPLYHVKFEYTYVDQSGVQQTTYKTSVFPDVLPETVGDLTSAVLDDAEAMASKYGHTLLSVTPTEILAV
jgi:hypothetical protein